MKELEIYNPFNTKNYYILTKNGKKYFCYNNFNLELSPGGYIPKSGLLFNMVLSEKQCKNKKVLDLGCGYLGILSLIAYANGASNIQSIDYDQQCVNWFNKIISDNELEKISCFKSNYYENITCNDFDLILANPPQMPMIQESLHDSGGADGRKYVLEILTNSINYLKKNAIIYMLIFDFLGIDIETNENPCLIKLAEDIGYSASDIVYSADKLIKKGGVTYKNINYINKIYPKYSFNDNNNPKCKMNVVRFRK